MTLPNSLLSYQDCLEAMDRALTDPIGLRIPKPSWNEANYSRMRYHQARRLDRDQNRKRYEPDHPMHGCSTYDELVFTIRTEGEKNYLYIKRTSIDQSKMELLSEVEGDGTEPASDAPELLSTRRA